jgi:flavin-dependent dehydrogenase
MFDVIIVGARCAGSPTAMLLARRGYRVLLVDKATFPSDTMSGHYIAPPGVARLARWGLLDRLVKSGCPPIQTTAMDLGEYRLTGTHLPVDGITAGFCPRRRVIDPLLAAAAVEAGAELREAFTVMELIFERGRVAGIRGRSRAGKRVTETARIVVGADGMYSMVAGSVLAREYKVVEPLTCSYYSYWSGVPLEGVELYPRASRYIFAAPTHDGLAMINVVASRAEFRAFRAETERHFFGALERAPEFADRVRAGRRVERFFGTADTTNFFRVPFGPGWALAGDAGHHKDPLTAHGMSDAFRDAECLAGAIDAGLSGQRPLEEALAGYQAERDAAVLPMSALTCDMARLAPPSAPMQALFDALRFNQADTDRFFGVLAGTVPVPEFLAPENQQRILAAAAHAPERGIYAASAFEGGGAPDNRTHHCSSR